MRSTQCAVLLVFLTGAVFAHSTCEEDIQQQLEKEQKEDADSHECRACKMITLESGPNCPPKGFDCDESLELTSTVLSLDSCSCVQLRCAVANATLAVDRELVKKIICKDRKWISRLGEAESAVCARPCGLRVCPEFPAPTPEEELTMEPLDVRAPDADHPCAWAECQYGAYLEYDTAPLEETVQGAVSFACTGNARWRQSWTEVEKRDLKRAYCLKQQEECGLGVCPEFPPLNPEDAKFLQPFVVRPPDADHPCAWAECEYGSYMQFDTPPYTLPAQGGSFACTGNTTWKYIGTDEEKDDLKGAYCLTQAGCEPLHFSASNPSCGKLYQCSAPTHEGHILGMAMVCPPVKQLRFTANNTNSAPFCSWGQWTDPVLGAISKESEVMCVYCPEFRTESTDAVKPVDKYGVLSCSSGQLTLEISPGNDQIDVAVASMTCSTDLAWQTTGGDWGKYQSLDNVITNAIPWTVRCKQ